MQHWQKLNFTDIRIGVLYVNVDFGVATNRNALGLHMIGDVLSEHAFNVHVVHQHEEGRHYVQYIYISEQINGTFTIQYSPRPT